MVRTETYEEIKPLIDLCKVGKLFDVQAWIASGKPVNPPPPPVKGARKKCPFQIALDKGFHSLVQVLLEGGANIQDGSYNALEQALTNRRLDLIRLLVEYGADINSVEMTWVFDAWDPKIIEYFIEKGADVETGYPLAASLCWKIRTALGVFKRHKDRFSTFQDQVNMALRHHCTEGNLKWVSLLLWAGADPFAKGSLSPDEELKPDEEELNAFEYAALYGHFDIFKLKQIKLEPNRPETRQLIRETCHSGNADFLKELMKKGFNPIDQEDGGSSLIQCLIQGMGYALDFDLYREIRRKNIDTNRTREKIKMVHILVSKGVKWIPNGRPEIAEVRRSFLRLKPDYIVEFIWIMSKYNACKRNDIEELIRTPAIKTLISDHMKRVRELLNRLNDDDWPPPAEP
jgi:hypothetical protein